MAAKGEGRSNDTVILISSGASGSAPILDPGSEAALNFFSDCHSVLYGLSELLRTEAPLSRPAFLA